MRRKLLAAAAMLSLASAPVAHAQMLPRKAPFGIGLAPASQTGGKPVVDQVFPAHTGEKLGLRKGDVIVELGGRPVADVAGVIAYTAPLVEGSSVTAKVERAGKRVALRGKAVGRPRETYGDARVDYGAVPFRGGHLRDLLVTPAGVSQPPVVFLIQGFSCVSAETTDRNHPYRRLGEELLKRGIAYYRVEKPGLGDSAGTPACADIDFATEMEAFRAAYQHLAGRRGFDPDRIFMFGHSLGGVQAPLLAAERPPRGVAVYGTVVRNWADYHQDLVGVQDYLFSAREPGDNAAFGERSRPILRRFYFDRQSPAAIAAADPAADAVLREALSWDGANNIFGRNFKFAQDLAHQPLPGAWRKAKTAVLSIYGESDVVALFDTDHKLIADIANWYRPGSARYVEIGGTDHGMSKVGDRFEFRQKTIAGGSPPDGEFNVAVAEAVADWVKETMAKPPVRTMAERTLPSPPASPASAP